MSEVTITVSGRIGSGKSAICGEIEILCKALGLSVEWVDGQHEKNLTHADWTEALEMYKPKVVIVEQIEGAAPLPSDGWRKDAERWRWAIEIEENANTLHSIVLCHEGDTEKIGERVDEYRAALAKQQGQ